MSNFSESRRSDAEAVYGEYKTKVFEMILNLLSDGLWHYKNEILSLPSNFIPPELLPNLILRALSDLKREVRIEERKNSYKILPNY